MVSSIVTHCGVKPTICDCHRIGSQDKPETVTGFETASSQQGLVDP